MIKKVSFLVTALVTVVAFSAVALVTPANAQAVLDKKIEICHSRQPQPSNGGGAGAQNNPYGPHRQSVNQSAADGINGNETGSDMGKGDHFDEHDGPVFNNTDQDTWGDIIPPIEGVHGGLNWDAQGQAIWNNDCQWISLEDDIRVDVACDVVNGELQNVVTLRNEGLSDGTADVNGETVTVVAQSSETRSFDPGVEIVVKIDDQTVYQDTPVCENGKGGEDTPAVQVSAPTGGVSAGNGAIAGSLAGLTAGLGMIGYGVNRYRKVRG